MKLKVSLLALFVAGLIVSVAIAGPPPGKGKPPGKDNGKNGAPAVSSTSLSTSTSTTGSTTTTTTPSGKKVQLCHRTHSKKKPWVLITVSRNALKAHLKHGDVLPVNGLCPSSQGTTTTVSTTSTTQSTSTTTTESTTTTAG